MTTRSAGLLSVTVLLGFGQVPIAAVPTQRGEQEQQIRRVISDALALLKSKNYIALLNKSVRPSEVRELVTEHGSIEQVASWFARSSRPPKLIKVLEAALTVEPSLNRAGDRAVFRFDAPIAGERHLTLQKIGSVWYFRD